MELDSTAINIDSYSKKLQSCFGTAYIPKLNDRTNHTLLFKRDEFLQKMKILFEEFENIMLLDICGVDNLERPKEQWIHGNRYESVYHLLNMENHQRLRVKVPIAEGETVPSVSEFWKSADWYQRESWDMQGIDYEDTQKERLLTHHQFVGHPLRKDYEKSHNQPLTQVLPLEESDVSSSADPLDVGDDKGWINIGPAHPATRGAMRILAQLEGEIIRDTKLEIGYLHRGIEKLAEGFKYNQFTPFTDRLNYCSSAMNNIGWAKAIEDMMGIEIPDRAKALRMIFAELARISDHLQCISTMASNIGAVSSFYFCLELREQILQLFEVVCGARINVSITRIGGMAYDLPAGWISQCFRVVRLISKSINRIDKMMAKNRLWMERMNVGAVSAASAIGWGYTGPCLRASGVNYDVRKNSPYYFYNEVDFEIPLGVNGDCYNRYLVRMEEIRQSSKIIVQILDNVPPGPIQVIEKNITGPVAVESTKNIEKTFNHIKMVTQGVTPIAAELYSFTEASNGELGFYVISDGTSCPYRVKIRAPGFPLFQSFGQVVTDSTLTDAIVTLGSMNIIAGEMDR